MNLFGEGGSELRDLFFESAEELLQALNDEGLKLEKHPGDPEITREIRRTVHTLKGDSAACGFRELSELAHELEDALTPELASRAGSHLVELVLSAADVFDALLCAYRANTPVPSTDHVRKLIQRMKEPAQEKNVSGFAAEFEWSEYEHLLCATEAASGAKLYNVAIEVDPASPMRMAALQLLKNVLAGLGTIVVVSPAGDMLPDHVAVVKAVLATTQPAAVIASKIKVPAITRQSLVQEYQSTSAASPLTLEESPASSTSLASVSTEEASAPVSAPSPNLDLQSVPAFLSMDEGESAAAEAASPPSTSQAESILRVDAERIDTVLNLVGELIIGKSMLNQAISDFSKLHPKDPARIKLTEAMAFQAQILTELQRSVMKIRMVPVEQLFRRFPRLVRDVSRASGKECTLVLNGQATDLDKSILDAISEPLMHLLRNAIDHGIELPSVRLTAGKPARGTLTLNAFYQGNQVVIELSDDGAGINRERVVAKAIQARILSQQEAEKLTEQEALSLIFKPGLSTAEAVTELSGRGMGMDIVESVLKRLKGSIVINTERGKGTTFQLRVPLTLAIMQALLFRAADRLYAVPLGSVVEIARIHPSQIHHVDHQPVLQLRDQVIPLVHIDALENRKPAQPANPSKAFVVVVQMGDRRFGLIVDKLEGEDELVIKALEDQLVATELVSGASILGDGTVVLILNVAAVTERLARQFSASSSRAALGTSA